jgi:ParB-like chromosome segregation protein Spo0J
MTKHAHIAEDLRKLAVAVADLNPDPSNARRHGERNLDAIKASLAAFGQRKPLVVQREGMIVRAGNGTLAAAQALGWDHIAAVVIDEDSAQAVQFAIADNRTAELAEWDNETLASLLDGMEQPIRDMLAFPQQDIDELWREIEGEAGGLPDQDNPYTQKVISPIYETTGERPDIADLFNTSKRDELQASIDAADLPDDVRAFLEAAAERHTQFRFDKIAEFYAHADAPTQRLMEDSALIIVDFEKAIEDGFVRLTDDLRGCFSEDYPDA